MMRLLVSSGKLTDWVKWWQGQTYEGKEIPLFTDSRDV